MPNAVQDPVIRTLKYAFQLTRQHKLNDIEAAIYSAAFVLHGPDNYWPYATEAALYSANSSGNFIDALAEANRRRASCGVLGSMDTIVDPKYNREHFTEDGEIDI